MANAEKGSGAGRGFYAPVYQGIFEHRKRIGVAVWEFILLINWVTKEVDDPDRPGEMLGVVLGGRPIPLREIADVLEESADSAKQHLARLKAGGYIKRAKPAAGDAYSYLVKRSSNQ